MTLFSTDPPLRKLIGSAALTFAVILAATGIALASGPVKGARYSGRVNVTANLTVSFKVSRSGKKVSSIKVSPSLPNSCGYGGPPPTQTSRPAKIEDGKFTMKITEKAGNGTVAATARITGRFLAKGKEKGTVKTSVPAATSCNGSFSYSAKVRKK
jgi:hypothetical protein